MTLLITLISAIVSTVIWYTNSSARKLKCGILCYMFWGASLMWFVDAVVEYMELREKFFLPSNADLINDTFLGLSVVVFALFIWFVVLFIKDPLGIIHEYHNSENE